jgi:hypothetical protein
MSRNVIDSGAYFEEIFVLQIETRRDNSRDDRNNRFTRELNLNHLVFRGARSGVFSRLGSGRAKGSEWDTTTCRIRNVYRARNPILRVIRQ